VPHVLYDKITNNLFIIYKSSVIRADLKSNDLQLTVLPSISNNRSYLGIVRTAHGHVFVPLGKFNYDIILGSDGLSVYKILDNGSL
jgi:hypothetical protein